MKTHYHTTTLTKKGQVHIPVLVRDELGISAPSRFKVHIQGKNIILEPDNSSILQLAGILKGTKPIKPVEIEKIRDFIDYSNL